jgi:dTDP-4-amino-4,6-dideoxygalactose transaminase
MISLADLAVGEDEQQRIDDVIESGMLTRGSATQDFEEGFAAFCGTDHGIATSNGTTALHAAFHALGIGEGDRVLTTPFSFAASTNAIRLCGATPVFADIDPETYNLHPQAAEEVLRQQEVDAILVVHAYGLPAEMSAFVDLADKYNVALVEDAAEAHGAEYDGQRAGSIGDAGCFSFYATKNMTTGEGGMVVTDRDDVAKGVRQFINHGRNENGRCVEVGHNFHMSDVTAAMGLAQLEKLPAINDARRSNAAQLTKGLLGVVRTPVEPASARHAYYLYTIRTDDRDGLGQHLAANDVQSGVYWSPPIHREPLYESVECSVPVTDQAAEEVLSLPVHPKLSSADIESIVDTVRDYMKQLKEI